MLHPGRHARSLNLLRVARRSSLIVVWVIALSAWGWSANGDSAYMTVILDANGRAQFTFGLSSERLLTPAQEQAISEGLGFALEKEDLDAEATGDDDEDEPDEVPATGPRTEIHYYSARGERQFDKHGRRIEAKLDLTKLMEAFRAAGLDGLLVLVTHAYSAGSECTPSIEGIMSARSSGIEIHRYQLAVAGDGPRLLQFGYGYSNGDLVSLSAPLVGVLLLPVLLAFWMRRSCLRPDRDPKSMMGSLLPLLNLVALGVPLLWMFTFRVSTAGKLIQQMIPLGHSGFAAAVFWALYIVPPVTMVLICYAVLQPAIRRARGGGLSSEESLWRVSVGVVGGLAPLMPLLVGINSLIRGDIREALLWALVAYVVRSLVMPALVKGSQISGHPLMVDGLRERLFELAVKAGVTLREVYVVPAGKGRLPNAFAASGNRVLLSEDLIRKFSRREVDAIAAHELAHLKSHHLLIKRAASIALILTPTAIGVSSEFLHLPMYPGYMISAGTVLAILAHFYLSRRFEFAADAGSIALTGDAEALVTALTRLGRLNFLPNSWGKWDEKLLTHPATSRRVAALAEANGISPERLNGLIDIRDVAGERYSLTAASTPRLPLSTTAKGNGRPRSGTRSMALAPFVWALSWATIAFLLAMRGGGMRPFLDSHSVPPLTLAAASGLIAFALKYYKTRRLLLRQMAQWVKVVATSPEQYPGLDVEAFTQYTAELEALGFVMCMDYTSETNVRRANLSAMGRLFMHYGHNCFAEVNQVLSGTISATAVGCGFMTILDDAWRLSSSNREPNGTSYAYRPPKSLWTAHPGASCAELLNAHLEWRSRIARDLGLLISPDLSEQHYFSSVERTVLENRKSFKRRNVVSFLLEIDRFDRRPRYEWTGDHSKLAHRVPMPDTPEPAA